MTDVATGTGSDDQIEDPTPRLLEIEAALAAPGGMFEIHEEIVLGEPMPVFAQRMGSLRELLVNSLGFGDNDYLVFTDGVTERRYSFREHGRAVASVAVVLRDRYGVQPGDRVAILGANSPEWIITFWATIALGAVAVGLNGWWSGPEIRYGIELADPRVLVVDRKRLARLDGEDPGVPTIVMEDDFEALTRVAPDAPLPDQPIDEDDPAIILFTSGTTGRPKGAVHTHRNALALLGIQFFHGVRMMTLMPPEAGGPPGCNLVSSPLFHVSGLHTAVITFLATGQKSVWTVGKFDPVTVMGLIEREKITNWSFTATTLHRIVTHPDRGNYDLTSLRSGGGGGSPFSLKLQNQGKEVFPNLRSKMGVGYGLTECTALATLNAGPELALFPDSCGRPLPTVAVEIRDPDGNVLPDGQEGEVCIHGPNIMLEYWRNPEATAETIQPGRWLRSGDIGWMDRGRLYLASRKRDMILRGGENVYPVEIEQRLEDHELVIEAAVVGVDHEDLGQEVKAVIVVEPGTTVDTDDLTRFCAEALAYFKVPAHWDVRTEPLPRNASGKVVKGLLVEGSADVAFIEE
ncbi:MAG: acyl-CoA synthetase (AMP-forming)/AMP-acid ligase [Actinomycetia bacterium]|nr:acyl-CoA synthetase (AMP-forming)/AMP-acid ligase [Actinomycetes bacterium]